MIEPRILENCLVDMTNGYDRLKAENEKLRQSLKEMLETYGGLGTSRVIIRARALVSTATTEGGNG
ncbi:hypothetical protein IC762_12070 [Bradyrhizobium genosp. L]|uniref:hypothetical protein n=1 Tax=Bradyrhizobium genosp. L TaxID=83637 RepID=UPI0018A32E7D|nr:hypothetical protein [Bradyrhizobium genosp. L]QPF86980.1 hypothetical protein IC762_12070 [Bradyrhizobium genosp. L]